MKNPFQPAPLLLAAALLAAPALASAQKLDLEKFHDVSGKAKRGYLEDVKVNETAGKIDLRFITKSTTKEVAAQTYHFNTKYELLGVEDERIPMQKVKGYRGENYSKEGVTLGISTGAPVGGAVGGLAGMIPGAGMLAAFKNPPGTLLIQRKRTDYKWSWLRGGYIKKVKLLETIKPKTEAGGGFSHVAHQENDAEGGVLVLARENMKLNNLKAVKGGFHLLYFNKDTELVKDTYLDVDQGFTQVLVEFGAVGLETDDEATVSGEEVASDVAIMLTYSKGVGKAKDLHPANEYQYLRVNALGEVKEKIRVDAPVGAWLVNGFVPMPDNSVLLYGPANDDPKKGYQEAMPDGKNGMTPEENFKAKNFVLGSIKGGAVQWITKTDLKEFAAKQQTPPGQKRSPDYTGKRFAINLASPTPNGDIFIGGQNFKSSAGSDGGSKFLNTLTGTDGYRSGPSRSFQDLLLFHFTASGELRTMYSLRRAENNSSAQTIPTKQFIRADATGKIAFWTVFEIDGMNKVTGLTEDGKKGGFLSDVTELTSVAYPSVTRIDLNAATIGPQQKFGVNSKEGKFYINNQYATLPVGADTQQLVFFGENLSGKTLWFGQLPIK